MKIQIASDLHLEFPENKNWLNKNPIKPVGDVLILAGDTVVNRYKDKAKKFFDYIHKNFKQIISIPGNHEFYLGEISYAYPDYSKKISENHIFLNNKAAIIDNVKFICSTLWSHVPEKEAIVIENSMNDYRVIYRKLDYEKLVIDTGITNKFNKQSIDFIKAELKKDFDGKIVVVTHHMPSRKCLDEDKKYNLLNSAYANDLDELIKENTQVLFCQRFIDLLPYLKTIIKSRKYS